MEKAIKEKTCNALLLKVNQIGSVTESIEAVKMSKRAGWGVMASHRRFGNSTFLFCRDMVFSLLFIRTEFYLVAVERPRTLSLLICLLVWPRYVLFHSSTC